MRIFLPANKYCHNNFYKRCSLCKFCVGVRTACSFLLIKRGIQFWTHNWVCQNRKLLESFWQFQSLFHHTRKYFFTLFLATQSSNGLKNKLNMTHVQNWGGGGDCFESHLICFHEHISQSEEKYNFKLVFKLEPSFQG